MEDEDSYHKRSANIDSRPAQESKRTHLTTSLGGHIDEALLNQHGCCCFLSIVQVCIFRGVVGSPKA
jgi:hypothetical protein